MPTVLLVVPDAVHFATGSTHLRLVGSRGPLSEPHDPANVMGPSPAVHKKQAQSSCGLPLDLPANYRDIYIESASGTARGGRSACPYNGRPARFRGENTGRPEATVGKTRAGPPWYRGAVIAGMNLAVFSGAGRGVAGPGAGALDGLNLCKRKVPPGVDAVAPPRGEVPALF
jgi:hypothetical protein